MRHQLKTVILLIGSLLTLTACAQSASVGIPTPGQATRNAQSVALTATAAASTPPAPTNTTAPQNTPTTAPTQVAPTPVPVTATPEQQAVQPTPTKAPAKAPTKAPSSNNTGSTSTCGRLITYIVKPGDNLFRIALRYRTTILAIARRNGISNTRVIHTGQRLRILTCARS